MRWVNLLLSTVVIVFLLLCGSLLADENQTGQQAAPAAPQAAAAPAAPAAPTIGNMTLDDLKKALGMSLYFQGGFIYNTRDPKSQENQERIFDYKSNSFILDLAQIKFQKDAPVGGLGYDFKFSAGETAKFIHANGLGTNASESPGTFGNGGDAFDLTEAYVSYNAPLGTGLRFNFGKFVTPMGAEVIEAIDDLNYSRSYLFNYAVPFTHTGLNVYYSFADAFNATFYLVNGWDNEVDNNNGKTVGLSFGVTPVKPVALTFNFMYGPEQNNNTSNERFLFDWVATVNATKKLTFTVNTDYATEQDAQTARGIANTKWYGIAGYAKYDFVDWFSTTIRAEYFKDPDGARTGIAQTLKEATLTTQFVLAKDLYLRPEYRHDWSDQNAFDSSTRKTQDTVSLGVMYRF